MSESDVQQQRNESKSCNEDVLLDIGFLRVGSSSIYKNKAGVYILSPGISPGKHEKYWFDIRDANLQKIGRSAKVWVLLRIVPDWFAFFSIENIREYMNEKTQDIRKVSGLVYGFHCDIDEHTQRIKITAKNDRLATLSVDLLDRKKVKKLLLENIIDTEKETPSNYKNLNDDLYFDINEITTSTNLTDTEKSTLIKARIGQGEFRKNVITLWGFGESCPVTKISTRELLVASHIKPWRKCTTKTERLDGANGILLCSHLDKLFDSHLVSFKKSTNDYMICINNKLNKQELTEIGITKSLRLDTGKVDPKNMPRLKMYLEEHYRIFSKNTK